MMDQQRPPVWPWVCGLLVLGLIAVISPPAQDEPRGALEQPAIETVPVLVAESSPPAEAGPLLQPAHLDLDRSTDQPAPPSAYADADELEFDSFEAPLALVSIESNPRVGNLLRVEPIASSLELTGPALPSATRREPVAEMANVPAPAPGNPAAEEAESAETPTEEPETQPAETAADSPTLPRELLDRLDRLQTHDAAAPWAGRVRTLVEKLSTESLRQDEAQGLLVNLRRMLDEGAQQAADQRLDPALATLWRRTQYAVKRRAGLWQASLGLESQPRLAQSPPPNPEQLASTVEGLEGALAKGSHTKKWREFLLVDSLQDLARRHERTPLAERTLARRVLSRLEQAQSTADRRAFLAGAPLDKLAQQLKPLTVQPVERMELLEDMERYERTALPSDARHLADARLRLASSKRPAELQLADQIDDGYRACNFRVAITADLLNRLLPRQKPTAEPVNTWIVGVPVMGQSVTQTNLALELVPDPRRMRMALVARGEIDASTTSSSGPVDLMNQSNAHFEARKPLEFNLQGFTYGPAQASVVSAQQLRGVRTNFDNVPLLGNLVRNIAIDEHANKSDQARMESEMQIRQRAERQLDESATERLAAVNNRLQSQLIVPLRRLGLDKSPTLFETTTKRMVIRTRLATDEQLAAHTPRPQAPSDSLASMQMHQTALNNLLEQLDLNGRSFQGAELMHHVAKKVNRDGPQVGEDTPKTMRMVFAAQDAIRARCQDGRVELNLSIAELELERKQWRNLNVRVFYCLEPSGNTISLVRDGTIQLSAERLTTRSQLMLRGLFSRIFSPEASWTLMGEQWAGNAALEPTEFSHAVVDDGWISVALTPSRTRTAARPTLNK